MQILNRSRKVEAQTTEKHLTSEVKLLYVHLGGLMIKLVQLDFSIDGLRMTSSKSQ